MKFISVFLGVLAFQLASHGAVADVPQSPTDVRPLLPGAVVPELIVQDSEGSDVDLERELSKGRTMLIFYRGGWCPYCNRHLMDIQRREQDFVELGFKVIALTPDKPENLKNAGEGDVTYAVYSDSDLAAAGAFGLAYQVEEKMVKRLKTFKIDLEEHSGKSHKMLPVPAVFLVDQGKVEFSYVNPDYKKRLSGDVLYEAAKFSKKN